ncbi:MAG TPA: cytochrome b N-terminal domain-containing protein [Actinomycetes bacterium]|jgi:menaquinol-cytochrome c reductase cytochrome b subunit|nr:cytochrome b N-terminal domain-containing protein [Actinomycetes bacterium]
MADHEPSDGERERLPGGEPGVGGGTTAAVAPPTGEAWRHAFRDRVKEQLGLRGMISEYMIPVETNTFWYTLGGVLAIALVLEIISGMVLALRYLPDAGQAYQITSKLLDEGGWSVALNFHYWTSYVIFGLVMIHMLRVFFSGGYRGPKNGLWQVGAGLAGTVFLLSVTGETLHWDERGFAVPWHAAEIFEAVKLDKVFDYGRPDLLTVPSATARLIPFYALHVGVLPILLLALIAMHYYLVKVKGISLPFWHKPTGRVAPFSEHVRAWLGWSALILGVVVLVSIFIDRDPGPAPQLLPSSPFYQSEHGPGGLGIVPTFPIMWTHGMNRFVTIAFGLEPDIWGTVIGMVLMTAALIVIPFVDRGSSEPANWGEGLSLRRRGWAFLAMALFWVIMIIGTVTNIVTPTG